jgi:hypothetical protein
MRRGSRAEDLLSGTIAGPAHTDVWGQNGLTGEGDDPSLPRSATYAGDDVVGAVTLPVTELAIICMMNA